jgi:uncharacterized protein (DUF427 family)
MKAGTERVMKPQYIKPGPGQESVWDYPRPPRVEDFDGHIQVFFRETLIVDTHRVKRVLETSHPPVYYIPPEDIRMECLVPASGTSICEWKGQAMYYDVVANDKRAERAAWGYPHPTAGFSAIQGHVAFYAGLMDACFVDGEQVQPQPGGFYGGWITKNIVEPFKDAPRTGHW